MPIHDGLGDGDDGGSDDAGSDDGGRDHAASADKGLDGGIDNAGRSYVEARLEQDPGVRGLRSVMAPVKAEGTEVCEVSEKYDPPKSRAVEKAAEKAEPRCSDYSTIDWLKASPNEITCGMAQGVAGVLTLFGGAGAPVWEGVALLCFPSTAKGIINTFVSSSFDAAPKPMAPTEGLIRCFNEGYDNFMRDSESQIRSWFDSKGIPHY